MAFNLFPFTNLHNLNTDWILKTIQEAKTAVEESLAAVQTALTNAVLYTSQSKEAEDRKRACTNIHAVSYDSFPLQPAERTQARANIQAADNATVVKIISQSLTGDEKAQARTNIGAAADSDLTAAVDRISDTEDRISAAETDIDNLESSRVSYAAAQSLNDTQKAQARTNIGAISAADIPPAASAVLYTEQSLTTGQQAQARTNIGAAASSAIPDVSDVLRYSSQSLTTGQKSQARTNINAASADDVSDLQLTEVYDITIEETAADTFSITGGNLSDAQVSQSHGAPVIINLNTINDGLLRGLADFTDDDDGDIKATLVNMYGPGLTSSYGYRISISNNGTSDVLSVSTFSYKLTPDCGILDNGKILKVSNGAASWAASPNVITDSSSTTATISSAQDDTIYKFTQDLTSLSLTSGTGSYMICFHSGSTPTTTSFPVSILGLDDFVPEKETYYEISIMDGRAVWFGWADPAVE